MLSLRGSFDSQMKQMKQLKQIKQMRPYEVSIYQVFHIKLNRKCMTSSLFKACANVEIDKSIMKLSYITI